MITSHQNERIKQLRKLQDKKHRDATGRFAAEGEDLVRAALAAGSEPVELFCAPDAPTDLSAHALALAVETAVLDAASALGSGSRVIGVFEQSWSELGDHFALTVFLDAIADPGNIGTVLRTAAALADGPVILGPNCADPFSPKAVRASMGAVFTCPPARATIAEVAQTGARLVALDGESQKPIQSVERADAAGPVTIVCIGAERSGLSPEALAAADVIAAIPMLPGGPESLNAAIAAGIALHELGSTLPGRLQTTVHEASETASTTGNPATNEK